MGSALHAAFVAGWKKVIQGGHNFLVLALVCSWSFVNCSKRQKQLPTEDQTRRSPMSPASAAGVTPSLPASTVVALRVRVGKDIEAAQHAGAALGPAAMFLHMMFRILELKSSAGLKRLGIRMDANLTVALYIDPQRLSSFLKRGEQL